MSLALPVKESIKNCNPTELHGDAAMLELKNYIGMTESDKKIADLSSTVLCSKRDSKYSIFVCGRYYIGNPDFTDASRRIMLFQTENLSLTTRPDATHRELNLIVAGESSPACPRSFRIIIDLEHGDWFSLRVHSRNDEGEIFLEDDMRTFPFEVWEQKNAELQRLCGRIGFADR